VKRLIEIIRSWLGRPTTPVPPPRAPLGARPEGAPASLAAFQTAWGLQFRDDALLRQALTHRSFLGGNSLDSRFSNERMEFLGDAVLELIVVQYLYHRYPNDREGDLTKKKGQLVCRDVLAKRALELHLGDYVLLSDAERDSGGDQRENILADAFEAVIGALYLDQGLEAAREFVHRQLLFGADDILADPRRANHKSELQELVQARYRTHPRYRVVTENGPDHKKLFTVDVTVRGRMLGSGSGYNKKEAEQNAAANALVRIAEVDRDGTLFGPGEEPA